MRDIRVYFKCLRIHLLSGVEYKGWWLMLLNVFFVVITDPLPTVLLFSRFGQVGDWTAERVILVYALAIAAFGMAESVFRGFDYFPSNLLRTGDFDRLLLRPCRLTVQVAASFFHIHRLVRAGTGIAAVCIALNRMGVQPGVRQVLTLLSAFLGGTLLYCGVFVLASGVAFYTVKGLEWINLFTNTSYQVTRCPIPYLPRAMKRAFTFLLPVLVVSYYPAAAVCGWGVPYWTGLLALPAGCVFFAFSFLVWRIGVRHYTSTGS